MFTGLPKTSSRLPTGSQVHYDRIAQQRADVVEHAIQLGMSTVYASKVINLDSLRARVAQRRIARAVRS